MKVTVTSIISLLPEVARSTGSDSDSDVMMVASCTKDPFLSGSGFDTHVLQEVTVTRIATSGSKVEKHGLPEVAVTALLSLSQMGWVTYFATRECFDLISGKGSDILARVLKQRYRDSLTRSKESNKEHSTGL